MNKKWRFALALVLLVAVAWAASSPWRAQFALDMAIHQNNDRGDFGGNVELITQAIGDSPNSGLYLKRAFAFLHMAAYRQSMDDIACALELGCSPDQQAEANGMLMTIGARVGGDAYRDMAAQYGPSAREAMALAAPIAPTPMP